MVEEWVECLAGGGGGGGEWEGGELLRGEGESCLACSRAASSAWL